MVFGWELTPIDAQGSRYCPAAGSELIPVLDNTASQTPTSYRTVNPPGRVYAPARMYFSKASAVQGSAGLKKCS